MIPRHVPLVETTRGGTTECVHYGSIAVVDAAGRLISAVGDPDSLNFTRSALKPLQADGLLVLRERGFELTPIGRLLMRNVAMCFDAYLAAHQASDTPRFSRAV